MAALTGAVAKGDLATAERLHRQLYPLCRALFIETSPVPVKAALAMMGKIQESYRLPLVPMQAANRAKLRAVLEAVLAESAGVRGAGRMDVI